MRSSAALLTTAEADTFAVCNQAAIRCSIGAVAGPAGTRKACQIGWIVNVVAAAFGGLLAVAFKIR